MGLAMATAIRQRAVKTSSGRATARGTGGLPALATEGVLLTTYGGVYVRRPMGFLLRRSSF